jgi:hypothetical protein
MGLLDELVGQLSGGAKEQIASQLGIDGGTATKAITSALPMLLGGLARNTKVGGADALAGALDRDHDGSILDDLSGYLGSAAAPRDDGILGHVFGDKRQGVETALGGVSGMDAGSAGKLMQMLAPLVLGALSKEKSRLNLDSQGLGDLLGMESERTAANGGGTAMKMLSQVLDSDGDGDIADDIASLGKGLLGSMFKKR